MRDSERERTGRETERETQRERGQGGTERETERETQRERGQGGTERETERETQREGPPLTITSTWLNYLKVNVFLMKTRT